MTKIVNHWIGGKTVEGASGTYGPVTDPATGAVTTQGRLRDRRRGRRGDRRREGRLRDLGHRLARQAVHDPLQVPRAARRPPRRDRRADHRRARQGALGRARRGRARPGDRRPGVRDHRPAEGRAVDRGGLPGRRRLDPPAARCRGRHHAVQLPGHGADVDVPAGHRVRQHLRAEAQREGPVGVRPARGAVRGGRAAGRRAERRPRRQGGRRPPPGAPGRQGGLLRRLDPDRPLHPHHRLRQRQARPGARRRQEPHAGPPGRRPGRGGRRGRLARPTARRASAAWPSRPSSPSARSATSWWRRSASAPRRSRSAPATTRRPRWAR